MSVNPDTVKVGDVLYSVCQRKAGNTSMSVQSVKAYRIEEITGEGWQRKFYYHARVAYMLASSVRKLRRSPPEFVYSMLFEPRKCYFCYGTKEKGHRADCEHPAAVRARKKAAKKEPSP